MELDAGHVLRVLGRADGASAEPSGRRMRMSLAWLVVLGLSGALAAQRYVVDATGGGDFTDLAPAITAVPEGSTLFVKAGSYAPFAIRDKSLTIVAEAQPCTVRSALGPPVMISDLSDGKRVLVSGLAIAQDLSLANNAGTVVLQGIDSDRVLESWKISGCADVHLLDVTLSGGDPSLAITDSSVEVSRCLVIGFGGGPVVTSTPGGTAMTVTGSRAWLAQTSLFGGGGGPARAYPNASGGDGGTALRVASASIVQICQLSGSTTGTIAWGGSGGSATFALTNPGAGGNGIEVDPASQVTAYGGSIHGGTGGYGFNGSGPSGKPLVGPVTWLPERVTPSLTTSGTLVPSGIVHLQLTATPDSVAVLVVGLKPVLAPQPFLQVGAMFVEPGLAFGPLLTDANGKLDVPLTIPIDYPGSVPAFVQFASLNAANSSFAASGSALLLGRY